MTGFTTVSSNSECCVDHQRPQLQKLMPLSKDHCAIVVAQSGEDVDVTSVPRPQGLQQRLQLDLEAHRRWNASVSVGFLNSVDHIAIQETRSGADESVVYVLEVYLSLPTSRLPTSRSDLTASSSSRRRLSASGQPTYKVERCFSDFEELRENVLSCVSGLPQCTCEYCMDFLVYIRYKFSQPRGIVKFMTGTEKRKQILTTFINDFVNMGQRRVEKSGRRKCEAQALVPAVLEAFLLDHAADC
ncbi:hypothetical protein BBJ28_00014458 [Nothophytophthora sp. Chile5]|nr:hypothetical protein BBJ28_00014458 [Nothophytophthora sp. Chile5]